MNETANDADVPQDDDSRREFLKNCGRFASVTPPAITLLLSTSLTSEAIAKSGSGDTGHGGGGDKGGGGGDMGGGGGDKGDRGGREGRGRG